MEGSFGFGFALLAILVHSFAAHPDIASRLPPKVASTCKSALNLCLRGGASSDHEEALKRYRKDLSALGATVDKLDAQFRKDFPEDQDVIGYSPRGVEMGSVPDCDIVEEPGSVDSIEGENWNPDPNILDEAMKAVDFIQQAADNLSPENIEKAMNARGMKLEDLHPKLNAMGTRMGNLTLHEQIRSQMLTRIDEIRTTHALLRHEMAQPAPVAELKAEISQMKEEEVNPYIKLLHAWKKNKEHEHESGLFARQYKALKKPLVTVEEVKGDKHPAAPLPTPAISEIRK